MKTTTKTNNILNANINITAEIYININPITTRIININVTTIETNNNNFAKADIDVAIIESIISTAAMETDINISITEISLNLIFTILHTTDKYKTDKSKKLSKNKFTVLLLKFVGINRFMKKTVNLFCYSF